MKLSRFSLCLFLLCMSAGAFAQATDKPVGPGLHARLFATHIQRLVDDCSGQVREPSCLTDFWKMADVSGDGALSIAEVTRVLRILAGHIGYQDYLEKHVQYRASPTPGQEKPENDEALVVLGAATVGPFMSNALMANYDYDDDGLLSLREVQSDIAAPVSVSSVDRLSGEIRSHAREAFGLLLQLMMKK